MLFILIVYLREFACRCLPTVTDRRHNERDDVSNHRRHDCLLKRLFMRKQKNQSPAPLASVRGTRRWPIDSPHKGPVTREMFPFHDIIMPCYNLDRYLWQSDGQFQSTTGIYILDTCHHMGYIEIPFGKCLYFPIYHLKKIIIFPSYYLWYPYHLVVYS